MIWGVGLIAAFILLVAASLCRVAGRASRWEERWREMDDEGCREDQRNADDPG